jgi:hypothetical protein
MTPPYNDLRVYRDEDLVQDNPLFSRVPARKCPCITLPTEAPDIEKLLPFHRFAMANASTMPPACPAQAPPFEDETELEQAANPVLHVHACRLTNQILHTKHC